MTSICGHCVGEIKRTDKSIVCYGWCDDFFHQKCTKLPDNEYKYIMGNVQVGWFCEKCTNKKANSMRSLMEEMKEALKNQSQMIINLEDAVKENNEQIQKELKHVVENQKCLPTLYSEKVKAKKSDPVVVLKPKTDQNANQTMTEIKKAIDPTELNISGLRYVSKGGVLIECKNEETVNKLKEEAQRKLGEKYDVTIPKKGIPRVKIVGLHEKISETEIEARIKQQNDYINQDNACVKVVYITETKNKRNNYTAFLEVDPTTYQEMLKAGKVNINWDRCWVYDGITVKRCYKCNGFNHKAAECKSEVCCPKCAEQHPVGECKAADNQLKCCNCSKAAEKLKLKLNTNHAVWSQDCSVLKKKLEVARSKIDFLG